MRSFNRIAALVTMVLLFAAPPCSAQSYPAKPIRMVLPFIGGAEGLARLVAQKMGESMGQPVVTDPVLGAGGALGAAQVARAAPDGYTFQIAVPGAMVMRNFLSLNVPYQPIKDFTPITMAATAVAVVVSHPSVKADSFKALLDLAKSEPGKITFSSTGIGGADHLAGELVNQLTGAGLVHVPYKDGGAALTGVLSGEVATKFGVIATVLPHIKSGKLKALAYITEVRSRDFGQLPLVRDSVPGFESPPYWMGYFGPANLPEPILKRLHDEIVRALQMPEVRTRFEDLGFAIVGNSPADFRAILAADVERVRKVVTAAGIKPE